MSGQLTWQTGGTTIGRRDAGVTFVEILVAIVLLGTAVVGTLAGVRATILSTTIERDHAKAQQWLQSAVGVIEGFDFVACDTLTLSEQDVIDAYQAAIDDPVTGAATPFEFVGSIEVLDIDVWDGTSFVDFASQSQCLDQFLLRQQRVTVEVKGPPGITEQVELIKRDRA